MRREKGKADPELRVLRRTLEDNIEDIKEQEPARSGQVTKKASLG